MAVDILDAEIADDLKPIFTGGITLYPASQLGRIFDWAEHCGRKIEGMDGIFYNPQTDQGQLSLDFLFEWREGADYELFKEACTRAASDIEEAAKERGMCGYFEIFVLAPEPCNPRSS